MVSTVTAVTGAYVGRPRQDVQVESRERLQWIAENVAAAIKSINVQVNSGGVANSTTVETDLFTYTLPPNLLWQNGMCLLIATFGTLANNANTKTLKLYFGGQVIFNNGGVTTANKSWSLGMRVCRQAASVQVSLASGFTSNAAVTPAVVATTVDETTACIVKVTGTSDTAGADILANYFSIELQDAITTTPVR